MVSEDHPNWRTGPVKHGKHGTPTYVVWRGMISRCYRERDINYKNYGARGIKVCEKWRKDFQAFLNDMGERPPQMSIERINNNLNYTPRNCRWATRSEQNSNQRKRVGCSSKYRGVKWHKRDRKWRATIKHEGKEVWIGSFEDEKKAALAYNKAAKEIRGKSAILNVIQKGE